MARLTTYGEVAEVLKSPQFGEGSHRESASFFDDSLLALDGRTHFDRRRLEARLLSCDALLHHEQRVLEPAIDQSTANVRVGAPALR